MPFAVGMVKDGGACASASSRRASSWHSCCSLSTSFCSVSGSSAILHSRYQCNMPQSNEDHVQYFVLPCLKDRQESVQCLSCSSLHYILSGF